MKEKLIALVERLDKATTRHEMDQIVLEMITLINQKAKNISAGNNTNMKIEPRGHMHQMPGMESMKNEQSMSCSGREKEVWETDEPEPQKFTVGVNLSKRPDRKTIIQEDEITDLRISLGSMTSKEFVEKM